MRTFLRSWRQLLVQAIWTKCWDFLFLVCFFNKWQWLFCSRWKLLLSLLILVSAPRKEVIVPLGSYRMRSSDFQKKPGKSCYAQDAYNRMNMKSVLHNCDCHVNNIEWHKKTWKNSENCLSGISHYSRCFLDLIFKSLILAFILFISLAVFFVLLFAL